MLCRCPHRRNARCSLRTEADQHASSSPDCQCITIALRTGVAEAYVMAFLVASGFAQQADVARAVDRSVRHSVAINGAVSTVGMAALGRKEGWRHGR
jgi:hypothetical protein